MSGFIQSSALAIVALLRERQERLRGESTSVLEDLLHESRDGLTDQRFSVRTAAEINRTACLLLLEERQLAADAGNDTLCRPADSEAGAQKGQSK